MKSLLLLPPELIIHVLSDLDIASLLHCRQVCHSLQELVDNAAVLRYNIELVATGMEDGPPGGCSPAERLEKLKNHQNAWMNLRFGAPTTVPMLRGGTWELYGGVLAQASGRRALSLKQLSSEIRGVEDREWSIADVGFSIRDFGMDPSQDLLVLIETPKSVASRVFHIHLRSLNTGASHATALQPCILSHSPPGDDYTFAIQISAEHLAVMFVSVDGNESELLVWNWRTGALVLWLCGSELNSFTFLSDCHILLAISDVVGPLENQTHPVDPHLLVINFLETQAARLEVRDASFICAFHYPEMNQSTTLLAMSLRSDPAPTWSPQQGLKVPFYTARGERLFIVTIWVAEAFNARSLMLFLPSSTVISHMKSLGKDLSRRRIPWDEWGPAGSRMTYIPTTHTSVWVCYVWGMKFVSNRRVGQRKAIQIHDFSQRAYRRHATDGNTEHEDCFVQGTTVTKKGNIFKKDVLSSLPYRLWTFSPPADDGEGNFDAVMVSEDTLITVASDQTRRRYRIFTL